MKTDVTSADGNPAQSRREREREYYNPTLIVRGIRVVLVSPSIPSLCETDVLAPHTHNLRSSDE